jgi:hypothetical protein
MEPRILPKAYVRIDAATLYSTSFLEKEKKNA